MDCIKYIDSFLDMQVPLGRKRLLKVKGAKALRSEPVIPVIEIQIDSSLDFMAKALEQIHTSRVAQSMNLPREFVRISKYKPKIM